MDRELYTVLFVVTALALNTTDDGYIAQRPRSISCLSIVSPRSFSSGTGFGWVIRVCRRRERQNIDRHSSRGRGRFYVNDGRCGCLSLLRSMRAFVIRRHVLVLSYSNTHVHWRFRFRKYLIACALTAKTKTLALGQRCSARLPWNDPDVQRGKHDGSYGRNCCYSQDRNADQRAPQPPP